MRHLLKFVLVFLFAAQVHAQRFVKYVDTITAMKALNTADVHKSVSVAGYSAAGDGGGGLFVWDASSTASTNYGTIFKGVTTGAELTTGRWLRVIRQTGPVDLAWFGMASAAADHPRFVNAISLSSQVLATVPFTLATNATISSGKRVSFSRGAVAAISSGITLTIDGSIEAGNFQIFSGSGTAAYGTDSPMRMANPVWFGALDSNTRTDDSLAAFNKAVACVAPLASRGSYLDVPAGNYWFSAGMTVPGSLDIRGDGQETTVLRSNFSTSGTLLPIPGNVEVRLRELTLINDPSTTMTNVGLSIGGSTLDLSKLEARNVTFKQWTACALSMTNVGYAKLTECIFLNNQNSTIYLGTTTTVARAIFLGGTSTVGGGTNYVTGLRVNRCRFSGNDQSIVLPYAISISVSENWFESEGIRLGSTLAPSSIHIGETSCYGFEFVGNYCEGNRNSTNQAFIRLENVNGGKITGNAFVDHYGGVHYGNSGVILTGRCDGVVIQGNGFSGTLDKFVKNYATAPVLAWPNSFDAAFALSGTLTNYTQLSAYMGTNVIFETEVDGVTAIPGTGARGSRKNQFPTTLTYGSTTTVDLRLGEIFTVTLTGNVTFATDGRLNGRNGILRIVCDGTGRNFTWPSWKFIGAAAPASIAASKVAIVRLECYGSAETDIVARYEVEP